jgi:hypothetical protein
MPNRRSRSVRCRRHVRRPYQPFRRAAGSQLRRVDWLADQRLLKVEPTVYRPSLLPEADAADQRIRGSRRDSGPPPSAMRPCVPGLEAARRTGGHGRRGWERCADRAVRCLACDLAFQDAYLLSSSPLSPGGEPWDTGTALWSRFGDWRGVVLEGDRGWRSRGGLPQPPGRGPVRITALRLERRVGCVEQVPLREPAVQRGGRRVVAPRVIPVGVEAAEQLPLNRAEPAGPIA